MSTSPDTPHAGGQPPDRHLPRLFNAGLIGWGLGTLALYAVSWIIEKPENASLAMLWTLHHWWIAFLAGLAALLLTAMVAKVPPGRGLLAFLLPVVVLAGLAALCLVIYPDRSLRDDLMSFLPVVLLFYALAWLWMSVKRMRDSSSQFIQAVCPPLVGGMAILGGVAAPAFASDAFRYRGAFELTLGNTKVESGALICEATLAIRKPGNYSFSAPRYVWSTSKSAEGSPDVELGEITWGAAGEPQAADGEFPFIVRWKQGVPAGGVKDLHIYEDLLSLEIRMAGDKGRVIHVLSAPLVER